MNFSQPAGIKNTVGRVTTQQYNRAEFMPWLDQANGDFGSKCTAGGQVQLKRFLNLFC